MTDLLDVLSCEVVLFMLLAIPIPDRMSFKFCGINPLLKEKQVVVTNRSNVSVILFVMYQECLVVELICQAGQVVQLMF